MKAFPRTILSAVLLLGTQVTLAESLMCGGTAIEEGTPQPVSEAQVLAACGEPDSRAPGQWVYSRPGDLTRTLRFDDAGKLMSIDVEYPRD